MSNQPIRDYLLEVLRDYGSGGLYGARVYVYGGHTKVAGIMRRASLLGGGVYLTTLAGPLVAGDLDHIREIDTVGSTVPPWPLPPEALLPPEPPDTGPLETTYE
jgi:hypothetical protein